MAPPLSRWMQGLAETSQKAFGKLPGVLGAQELGPKAWDELEGMLIGADLGVQTAQDVLASLQRSLRQHPGKHAGADLRLALREELLNRISRPDIPVFTSPTKVILIVGVNGSGKTTTIAKLVRYFQERGKSVLLGAADTFRAAADEQLGVWAERLGVSVIKGAPQSDPGAVAFNTIQSGLARSADIVIIDTAGRLHSRSNLMDELKKVHRVAGKALAGAPHAVWLVLDATTGQNAIAQARGFREAVPVSGIVLAKLDASARGGMTFAIQKELGIPILFAGLGEGLDDLEEFDPEAFVAGILA